MSAVKLTKAQLRVLKRMATGDEVWTVTGRRPNAFWHGSLADRAPSFATLHALWRAGAIENHDDARHGHKYCITPAGRAALSQGEEA